MSATRQRLIRWALGLGLVAAAVIAATMVPASSASPRARQAVTRNGVYVVWGVPRSGQSGLARSVIRVNSISVGAGHTISSPTSTGQPARASFSEVTVSKDLNSSTSPRVFQAFTAGNHFDALTIRFVRNSRAYLVMRLTDVLVSGYSIGVGNRGPSESFTLSFGKVEIRYGNQNVQPGTVGNGGWDLSYSCASCT